MDRDDALKALDVLRQVVSQARDDSAVQNWGSIWMVHGVTNGAAFFGTHLLVARGVGTPWWFAGLWAVVLAVNIGVIFLLRTRTAGARSFVENQIRAIWLTFVAAVAVTALVNHLMGFRPMLLGPVIAVLSGVGFASMGAVVDRQFYISRPPSSRRPRSRWRSFPRGSSACWARRGPVASSWAARC